MGLFQVQQLALLSHACAGLLLGCSAADMGLLRRAVYFKTLKL